MQTDTENREGRASSFVTASSGQTVPPDLIDTIRLNYRLAKSAEDARKVIDQKLVAFARVYLTDWTPDGEELTRTKANSQAMRVVKALRKDAEPAAGDEELHAVMGPMVLGMEPSRATFDAELKLRRKNVEPAVRQLPAWAAMQDVAGFSAWGLGAIIGEVGDIGKYSGCRKLYKRLGFAPDECYPRGEKSTGRMIPRATRGRIWGIIADPLRRAQWRGPRDCAPGYPIGPFGAVYGEAKARQLASGKTAGHADKLAIRAMVKALLHDVWRSWHGLPRDYDFDGDGVSHCSSEGQCCPDHPAPSSH